MTINRDDGGEALDMARMYPNVTVEVYNRWGELIFKSKGYNPGEEWNGKHIRTDEDLPADSYHYCYRFWQRPGCVW
ncbi:MAG: hypothetical protein HC896_06180 [Bacteroidales bacterium]|nr:hypothetical protein [Bacteroidales bacterium]